MQDEMNLLAVGISHHTATVELRERMWMSTDEIRQALLRLHERFLSECFIVSTCNRTELYGVPKDPEANEQFLKSALIDFKGATDAVRPEHFFCHLNGSAVNHLFKVAAGIDSMVIGDIQILNQVKEAFQQSRDVHALGPIFNRLMQSALHVGKRTRTETLICDGAVSVSYAAVELANKIFADLTRRTALLIGAGETGELTMKHLVSKGIGKVRIANRTREKAEALVNELGGEVVEFSDITDALRSADILITSVGGSGYVVSAEQVATVIRRRSHSPLFIIDIGVPRNVDPGAGRIDNVFLYDIDSLTSIVDRNLEKRTAEVPLVTRIIREELVEFFRWYNSLQVSPTIQGLHDVLESIRQGEVSKNINRFKPEDRELVEMITRRIVNKILHTPLTNLKEGAENGSHGAETMTRVKVLRDLFGLSSSKEHRHDE
jgi:glutamyl-tRNA reductase